MLEYGFDSGVLVHNGIITGFGKGDMSDTQEFVEHMAAGLCTLDRAGTNNKIAILTPDCKIVKHGYGWVEHEKRSYSNRGFEEVKPYVHTNRDYGYDDEGYVYGAGARTRKYYNAWSELYLKELGLSTLGKEEWIGTVDGSYLTAQAIVKMYSDSTYATSYNSVTMAVDAQDVVWLCFDYKRPVPCGTLVTANDRRGQKAIRRYLREREVAEKNRLEEEANKAVTIGPLVSEWAHLKVGDRVQVLDPTVPLKNLKYGQVTEIPDFKRKNPPSTLATTTGADTGVNNKCKVTLDNGETYATTKVNDLLFISSGTLTRTIPPVNNHAAELLPWRGIKIGDRVMVDDMTVPAKNGQLGVVTEMPKFAYPTDNKCVVNLDLGGKYQTTKPTDLVTVSRVINPGTTAVVPAESAGAPVTPGLTPGTVVVTDSSGTAKVYPINKAPTPGSQQQQQDLLLAQSLAEEQLRHPCCD
jgi:hypothetical protein